MALDFSKPENLQARDGREVRIYATDHSGDYPIVGAVRIDDGWRSISWTQEGSRYCLLGPDPTDLIPKPTRIKGWVNVYAGDYRFGNTLYETKEKAARKITSSCIGQIYIDAEVQT